MLFLRLLNYWEDPHPSGGQLCFRCSVGNHCLDSLVPVGVPSFLSREVVSLLNSMPCRTLPCLKQSAGYFCRLLQTLDVLVQQVNIVLGHRKVDLLLKLDDTFQQGVVLIQGFYILSVDPGMTCIYICTTSQLENDGPVIMPPY